MLVDDDELMREGLRVVLSSDESIEVVEEVDNGSVAIQRAPRARPDVVLIDARMPEMDGIAATGELIDAVPEAKVVFPTTFEEDEYILGALRAGARGFLLKRTSAEELTAAISTVAAGKTPLSPSVTWWVIDRKPEVGRREPRVAPGSSRRRPLGWHGEREHRRAGRRPGNSSSREDIFKAARELFAKRGYQGATMRAIAAKAGVDASLLVHFFGNKVNLLAEAIEWPFDPEVEMPRLLADGKRNVGRRLAELAIHTWDDEGTRHPVFTLLRAGMTEPEAAEMLRNFMIHRLYAPLTERLGSDKPELRAGLAVSQIIGVGMGRYVLKFEGLASAKSSEAIDWLAPVLQGYLTGKLD